MAVIIRKLRSEDDRSLFTKLGFIELDVVSGELGERPQPLPMFIELRAIPRP